MPKKHRRRDLCNPRDDPEFYCCCNIDLHICVLIWGIMSSLIWLSMGIWRLHVFSEYTFVMMLVMTSLVLMTLANVALVLGNIWRVARLYRIYFVLALTGNILAAMSMSVFVGDRISDLTTMPHPGLTEDQLDSTEMIDFRFLSEWTMGGCLISCHLFVAYMVYRDYNFVRVYPRRRRKHSKASASYSTTESITTTTSGSSGNGAKSKSDTKSTSG